MPEILEKITVNIEESKSDEGEEEEKDIENPEIKEETDTKEPVLDKEEPEPEPELDKEEPELDKEESKVDEENPILFGEFPDTSKSTQTEDKKEQEFIDGIEDVDKKEDDDDINE